MIRFRTSLIAFLALAGPALAQESSAPIDAPVVVADRLTRFQKLVDIDGDGYLDAFSGWWNNDDYAQIQLSAFRNDQTGRLVETWTRYPSVVPSGTQFWAFAAGDVDASGTGDVVFGAGLRVNLFLTLPDGLSQPSFGTWTPSGSEHVRGLALLNVDGGPEREIAVVHGDLSILRYDAGAPGMLVPIAQMPLGAVNGEVQAADLDGDGLRDLMVWDATRVFVIPVVRGALQTPTIFLHGRNDPRGQVGDIDGDGDEDIVVFDFGTYVLLRRTGPSSFAFEGPFNGGPARYLHDVDDDGDVDGICCGGPGGPSEVFNLLESKFRIALNDGTGVFAPAIEIPSLGSERLAGAGDLDHDGDVDLVAGRCVYYSPGAGAPKYPPNLWLTNPHEGYFADLDGDGDPDLEPGQIVRRNFGEGTFTSHASLVPAAPLGSEFRGNGFPGDFDGDGDADLVVALWTGGAFQRMQLLKNSGGGSFVDGGPAGPQGLAFSAFATGPQAREALARDADGDGDIDLLVRGVAIPNHSTKIYWNDGQGSFVAGPSWTHLLVRHVADLNGDGLPELLGFHKPQTYATVSDLYMFAGLGGGAFPATGQVLPATSKDPWSDVFDLGDADGDGDLDLALLNYSENFALLTNTGYPVADWNLFTMATIHAENFSSEQKPFGALFSDVNADGRLDVVAWPVGYYTLAVPNGAHVLLRKTDNSGYQVPFQQIVRPGVALDVDGDGDGDLVGSNLYRCRAFEGEAGGLRLQVGDGAPGSGGVRPTLGARGPFRVGEAAELLLTGAAGGVSGWLHSSYVSDTLPPFTGGGYNLATAHQLLAPIPLTTSGSLGAAGEGRWSQPFTVPGYDAGTTVRYQAVLDDAGAPAGKSSSNLLLVTFGP